MNVSDLPSLDSIKHPLEMVPQTEIDRINDLYVEMRRKARHVLKDAIEIGEWFIPIQAKMGRYWGPWLKEKFPRFSLTTIYTFIHIAKNRDYIDAISKEESVPSINEAIRMIRAKNRTPKPRVRAIVVAADASPEIQLEAKLKNYVISLWQLRYLQTEIEGLITAMELKPAQILKVLRYVCKEHREVEEEVIRTFKPGLKIVSKGA